MKHLYLPRERSISQRKSANLSNTSAAYQTLSDTRDRVTADLCLKIVQEGWARDPNERNEAQRPLLISYLGTFLGVGWKAGTSERLGEEVWTFSDTTNTSNTGAFLGAAVEHAPDGSSPLEHVGPWMPKTGVRVALALLEQGANPYAQDADGRDTLDQTNSLGWVPLMQALLQRSDVPSLDDLAQRRLFVDFLDRKKGMELPWLHAHAANGRIPMLEQLLDHGLNVDQRDEHGRTPLFYAQSTQTLRVLMARGANPLAKDDQGQPVGKFWARTVEQSTDLSAMNVTLDTHIKPLFEQDEQGRQAFHRTTFYDLVRQGTKENVTKFMRINGFTVDDRNDKGESAFFHANMATLLTQGRSASIATHFLTRLQDPWHTSLADAPDVLIGWLTACSDEGATFQPYRQALVSVLAQRYDFSTVEGFTTFLEDTVSAADACAQALPTQRSTLGKCLAQTLCLAIEGESIHTPIAGSRMKNIRKEIFAPADWDNTPRDTLGSYASWLAHRSCILIAQTPSRYEEGSLGRFKSALSVLLEHNRQKRGEAYDTYILHAFMGPFSEKLKYGEMPGFSMNNLYHLYFEEARKKGVEMDPFLPGYEATLVRIREVNPPLAEAVEQAALRKALEAVAQTIPTVAPKARSRL